AAAKNRPFRCSNKLHPPESETASAVRSNRPLHLFHREMPPAFVARHRPTAIQAVAPIPALQPLLHLPTTRTRADLPSQSSRYHSVRILRAPAPLNNST